MSQTHIREGQAQPVLPHTSEASLSTLDSPQPMVDRVEPLPFHLECFAESHRAHLKGGVTERGVLALTCQYIVGIKNSQRGFFWKVLTPKIFLVFSCLAARPVKAYIALPMRKTL